MLKTPLDNTNGFSRLSEPRRNSHGREMIPLTCRQPLRHRLGTTGDIFGKLAIGTVLRDFFPKWTPDPNSSNFSRLAEMP
jgi:hypothetical protein